MTDRPAPGPDSPRPGEHVCIFYRGQDERDRLLSACLRNGLRAGHACLCVGDSADNADVLSTVTGTGQRMSTVDVVMDRPPRAGLRAVAPGPILGRIRDWLRLTFERDRCCVGRVVADMNWLFPMSSRPSLDDLVDYEAGVTASAQAYPNSVICLYDMDRCASVAYAVIKAHSRVCMDGVTMDNPYSRDIDSHRAVLSEVI